MSFAPPLSAADAQRAARVLEKLARCGLRDFALTGGLAVEAQLSARGHPPRPRLLNDLDLAVDSFAKLPLEIADRFLFRHIHPGATRGKTLVQLVDPGDALRVDVFRACGATLARAAPIEFPHGALAVVALEDLAARKASLLMNLERECPVPSKDAADFLRLADAVDPSRIAAAWADQRKDRDPESFPEASARIARLVELRRDLLVTPEYSRDVDAVCQNCRETASFRLAPAAAILSILGYC